MRKTYDSIEFELTGDPSAPIRVVDGVHDPVVLARSQWMVICVAQEGKYATECAWQPINTPAESRRVAPALFDGMYIPTLGSSQTVMKAIRLRADVLALKIEELKAQSVAARFLGKWFTRRNLNVEFYAQTVSGFEPQRREPKAARADGRGSGGAARRERID